MKMPTERSAEEIVRAKYRSARLQSHEPVPPIFPGSWFIWNFGIDGESLLSDEECSSPDQAWQSAAARIKASETASVPSSGEPAAQHSARGPHGTSEESQ